MADAPARPMKYPYTLTAKMAQFPYKHYFNNNWMFRYWIFGIIAASPVFYKLGKMSYSPENVEKWKHIRKHNFEEPHFD